MAKQQKKYVRRVTDGLEVIFTDERTCYIKSRYGMNIYQRWFIREHGFYGHNWRKFREALLYNRHIDLHLVNRLVEKYEILVESADAMPDMTGQKVVDFPEHGRERKKN